MHLRKERVGYRSLDRCDVRGFIPMMPGSASLAASLNGRLRWRGVVKV
jgi:hypothetical protein